MTIAMLLQNTLQAFQQAGEHGERLQHEGTEGHGGPQRATRTHTRIVVGSVRSVVLCALCASVVNHDSAARSSRSVPSAHRSDGPLPVLRPDHPRRRRLVGHPAHDRGQADRRGLVRASALGPGRGRRLQGVAERALVLQSPRRRQPGALLPLEAGCRSRRQAAGRRHRGVRPRAAGDVRGQGRVSAQRRPACSRPPPSARRSGSSSG